MADMPIVDLAELQVAEPVLVPLLRQREADQKVVTVHLVDGSTIAGQVDEVTDATATVINGRDEYTFDVSAVVVIQTRRQEK